MDFSINFSTIKLMLDLIGKVKSGYLNETELDKLIKHNDYKFEFSRYKGRVSEEEFADYILRLPSLKFNEIKNNDLKIHHSYYMDLLNNLDYYIEKEEELHRWLTMDIFEPQIKLALKGLPENFQIPEIRFVFTIGIGQSFGYAWDGGIHFDFLQLAKEKSIEEFCSTIAHEVHHIGMDVIHREINFESLPLEEMFYICFTGEGLAVKYCNNAEGIISKSIYDGPKNIGLDSYTWNYLNADFENTMEAFKRTINRIRGMEINSKELLFKELSNYWMNPLAAEQQEGDIPMLKHFRLYTFGNDIWGVIHDCFGKEKVFDTIKKPGSFPEVFNKAMEKNNRLDLRI